MATVREHEQLDPHAHKPALWLRILAYARPYVPLLGVVLVLTLGVSVAEFGRAYLLKVLIDDVAIPQSVLSAGNASDWLPELPFLGSGKGAAEPKARPDSIDLDDAQRVQLAAQVRENLITLLGLGALIVLALPLLSFAREFVKAYTLGHIGVDMSRDACSKLLALPLSFHHGRKRGDVYARVGSDLGKARSALDLLFSDVAQAVLSIAVGVGFLVYVSWQLSLTLVVFGPLLFLVISSFSGRIRSKARKRQAQVGEVTQSLLEILSGIKVIKAYRAEAAEEEAYRRGTEKLFRRSLKVVRERLLARGLVELLNHVVSLGGLCLGSYLLLKGMWGISLGGLAAFFVISNQIYRPLKKLAKGWVQMMDAEAGARRFLEVMDAPIEIQDAPGAVSVGPLRRRVAFCNVTFGYDPQEPVLRRVSFEALAGEVVAMVGPTGAGKTTLTDLMLRFHDPSEGSIEIDGVDLRQVTRDSLLAQIAVVTQEPFLFDGSIRENLRYGRPDATDDEVLAAARAAHVDDFVSELPLGYDTEVGSSGVRLSGGQRQRITIGRAILKDPSILILDEATSSLDSKSEKFVQEAIDGLLSGDRTVLVVAHRLSTVRRADRIVVLENGTVSQQGTHDELIAAGGLYRELVQLQALGYADAPAAQ